MIKYFLHLPWVRSASQHSTQLSFFVQHFSVCFLHVSPLQATIWGTQWNKILFSVSGSDRSEQTKPTQNTGIMTVCQAASAPESLFSARLLLFVLQHRSDVKSKQATGVRKLNSTAWERNPEGRSMLFEETKQNSPPKLFQTSITLYSQASRFGFD